MLSRTISSVQISGSCFDLVVARYWLDFGEELPGFRLENRNGVVRPGKGSHGIQRYKQVHYSELDLIGSVLAQDVAALIAINALEARENLLTEKPLIGICIFKCCPAFP